MLAGVATLLCFSVPGDVKAELQKIAWVKGDDDDDYWSIIILRNTADPKSFVLYFWYKDGTSEFISAIGSDNPDPGGESSGPKGDRQSIIALAKQHGGGNMVSEQEFWDSPLGQMLTAKGKGPGAVINPGGDDPGGGPAAPSRAALKALKALGKGDGDVSQKLGDGVIIDKTGPIGSGEGGFEFNAGSPAEQLKNPGGPGGPPGGGGGSDDDDDKGSNRPPPGSNFGPAELVDPLGPPTGKSAKRSNVRLGALGGPDTKSAKEKPGESALPYGQQKSLKKTTQESRKQDTKGMKLGVNAFMKPVAKTDMGNSGWKGKANVMTAPGLLETNKGFAAHGPSALGGPLGTSLGTRGHR